MTTTITSQAEDNFHKINSQSEEAFRALYKTILKDGKECAPRGQKVIELEHFTYELPAYVRFPSFEARGLKLDYIKREFLWYLRGNRMDISITKHASMWLKVMNKDNSINSNYGQYIFARTSGIGPAPSISAFEGVIAELTRDPDSRRASIPILAAQHYRMETNDVPCTYSLNFRIREGKVNMSVHMRSQDAIFGLGNDAPAFSFVHEMVFAALKALRPELEMGTYTHTADSLHVYERHFEMLQKIVDGSPYIPITCPRISSLDEVRHLVFGLHSRYSVGQTNAWCRGMFREDPEGPRLRFEAPYSGDLNSYEFANWLVIPELADDQATALAGQQPYQPVITTGT
jgi:thymidylate synthase